MIYDKAVMDNLTSINYYRIMYLVLIRSIAKPLGLTMQENYGTKYIILNH